MRITYKMSTTKYTSNLNDMSVELGRLNTQVASGRKYAKTSEDTSSAIKGYQIRRSLSKLEGYQSNIGHASDFLTNSETALSQIEGSASDAINKMQQGLNGTQSKESLKIIATALRSIQDEMLQTFNTKVNDTYIFGGSHTEEKPFTVDDKGKLFYNGVDLDTLTDGSADLKTLSDDALYVDIGLGISYDGSKVKKNTVFNYSTPGVNFAGNGKVTLDSGGEVSNNLYSLIGEIATEFESATYNHEKADNLFGQFQTLSNQAYQSTTEIGSKSNYLKFMTDRYDSQNFNLQERQLEVEGADPVETYIAYKTQKVAYDAALQMGGKLIQASVFDYMS
jgi:flagellar hook-associated protein 3 FlgL